MRQQQSSSSRLHLFQSFDGLQILPPSQSRRIQLIWRDPCCFCDYLLGVFWAQIQLQADLQEAIPSLLRNRIVVAFCIIDFWLIRIQIRNRVNYPAPTAKRYGAGFQ
jgi:hypothetical protein